MLSYVDSDSMILNLKTSNLLSDLENLQKELKMFDFGILNK